MEQLAKNGSAPELTIDGAVATIRLCRPAHANRIEVGDVGVLAGHFAALRMRHEQVRALVITAGGKHFSAGFDLGVFASGPDEAASDAFAAMIDLLEDLPQVTVCALNGGVFGGATDLALACDFRIGVPGSRMFMPAARFGLHYYASGLHRYLARLGLNTSKRLFLLAEELNAAEMLKVGYLTEIAPAEFLQEHAYALATKAAAMAPLASSGMKAALNAMAAGRYDPVEGAGVYRMCMRSADLREGVAAAQEKRTPLFEMR